MSNYYYEGLEQRAREYTAKIFNGATPSEVVDAYIVGATDETRELKKQLEHRNCVDCSNHGSNIKLFKAKEMLKEFVHHYKDKTIYIENMQDLLEQVEQFLKDSEVEK